MNKKILLVLNIIAPYRIEMFNEINNTINDDFTVWFMSKNEPNREWTIDYNKMLFKYEILRGISFSIKKPVESYFHFNFGFFIKLIKNNPDVVIIGGYNNIHYYFVKLYTKLFKKKMVLWNESQHLSSRKNKGIIKFIKKMSIPMSDSYLVPSKLAKDYLVGYGANENKINYFYNTVNPDIFNINLCDKINNDKFKLVYVGLLEERKGVKYAIEALKEINEDWELNIIGNGSIKNELEKMTEKYNLKDKINFLGFLKRTEIAQIFSNSDYFIFPTLNDPCPLVVNEALSAGLFCILSKFSGNADEFIINKSNGLIIDPLDKNDFIEKIKLAFSLKNNISKCDIKRSIEKASPKMVSLQFKNCIDKL